MNTLIKIIINDDGEEVENPDWCIAVEFDVVRTVCGHVLDGDSSIEMDQKEVFRGGITCRDCLRIVKDVKSIRL